MIWTLERATTCPDESSVQLDRGSVYSGPQIEGEGGRARLRRNWWINTVEGASAGCCSGPALGGERTSYQGESARCPWELLPSSSTLSVNWDVTSPAPITQEYHNIVFESQNILKLYFFGLPPIL